VWRELPAGRGLPARVPRIRGQCYGHVTVHMGCATLNSMREMDAHDEAR
jgi:hypothetical protein